MHCIHDRWTSHKAAAYHAIKSLPVLRSYCHINLPYITTHPRDLHVHIFMRACPHHFPITRLSSIHFTIVFHIIILTSHNCMDWVCCYSFYHTQNSLYNGRLPTCKYDVNPCSRFAYPCVAPRSSVSGLSSSTANPSLIICSSRSHSMSFGQFLQ
jgi:hypothetical protein